MSHIPTVLAEHIPNNGASTDSVVAKLPSEPASQFIVLFLFTAIFVTLLGLFIFWRKRHAKMMYQAWALFALVLYTTIFLNYILPSRLLTGNQVAFTFFMMFINSTITIFRSWRDAEKYIPKRRIEKLKRERINKAKDKSAIMRCIAKTKLHAFWITLKNGGNDIENAKRVKRELSRHLAT